MSRITITIAIDVPEGASVRVSNSQSPTFGELPAMEPWGGDDEPPPPQMGSMVCPDHGNQFTWKEPGVSANGKPYDGFWKCGAKLPNGGYCQRKPK